MYSNQTRLKDNIRVVSKIVEKCNNEYFESLSIMKEVELNEISKVMVYFCCIFMRLVVI